MSLRESEWAIASRRERVAVIDSRIKGLKESYGQGPRKQRSYNPRYNNAVKDLLARRADVSKEIKDIRRYVRSENQRRARWSQPRERIYAL